MNKHRFSRKGTLFLSPHSDDMAMSAYHILKKGLLPKPYYIATVFSYSNYSKFKDVNDPDKMTFIRIKEDVGFCNIVGAKLYTLNIPDCEMRHGDAIFDSNWPLEKENDIIRNIQTQLNNIVKKTGCKVLASPWPCGNYQHLDHRLVYYSVANFALNTKLKLVLLDDQPYSRRPMKTIELEPYARVEYRPFLLVLDPEEISLKHIAMSIYKSQMCNFYHKAIDKPAPDDYTQQPSETLWIPVDNDDFFRLKNTYSKRRD